MDYPLSILGMLLRQLSLALVVMLVVRSAREQPGRLDDRQDHHHTDERQGCHQRQEPWRVLHGYGDDWHVEVCVYSLEEIHVIHNSLSIGMTVFEHRVTQPKISLAPGLQTRNCINMDALTASRREYTDQLVALTRPLFVQGLLSLYGHVLNNNKNRSLVLRELQQALRSVRQWSHETLVREELRFLTASRYEWLEELLKAVFIVNVQILTQAAAVEAGTLDVQVPSLRSFIHRTYIELSRCVWRRPELLHHAVPTEQRQANLAMLDRLVENAILATIRDSLPYRELLPRVLHPPPPPPPPASVPEAASVPASSTPPSAVGGDAPPTVGGGAGGVDLPASFTPINMSVAPSLVSEPASSAQQTPPPPPHALSDSPEPPPSWKGVAVTREEDSERASVAETNTTSTRKRAKYTKKRRTDGFTPEPEPEPEREEDCRQLIIAPSSGSAVPPNEPEPAPEPAIQGHAEQEDNALDMDEPLPAQTPQDLDDKTVNVVRAGAAPDSAAPSPKPRRRRADAVRRALAAEKTLSAR